MDDSSPFKPAIIPPKKFAPRKLNTFKRTQPVPLWRSYLYRTHITLLSGEKGMGKTKVLCDLAVRAARGGPWPGETATFPPLKVVFILVEDSGDYATVMFDDAGLTSDVECNIEILDKAHDVIYSHLLSYTEPVDLIIFETLDSHLERNSNVMDPVQARQNLASLEKAAELHNAAVIGARHWNKQISAPIASRTMGSAIIPAVARVCLDAVNGIDSQHNPTKLIVTSKVNYTATPPPLCYQIKDLGGDHSCIDWAGHDPHATPLNSTPKIEKCIRFIMDNLLPNTPLPAKEIKAAISQAGFGLHTMEEAQTRLNVRAYQKPGGGWVWERS